MFGDLKKTSLPQDSPKKQHAPSLFKIRGWATHSRNTNFRWDHYLMFGDGKTTITLKHHTIHSQNGLSQLHSWHFIDIMSYHTVSCHVTIVDNDYSTLLWYHILCHIYIYTGWWFQPIWKIWVNWNSYSQYIYIWKIKAMFQTTNQLI